MAVSYIKLWHLLLDKNLKKEIYNILYEQANIT